jgi:putative DNA methylase
MAWDFVETNCIEGSLTFATFAKAIGEVIQRLPADGKPAVASQADAATFLPCPSNVLICTDPPYYSNISYANLSDFFYVWLRKCLFSFYPELFSTLLVPKAEELIATPYRFDNDNQKAQEFFESGFGKAMHLVREKQSPDYPMTIFYAFRETDSGSEKDAEDATVASTGWETMLEGLISADFQITGTWPMRSERSTRAIAQGTNALASSVVLVCRPRPETAALTTRKDFISTLKQELGPAVRHLQQGNIAPVDLQQAAIGPGMAIFSRHRRVLESDGSSMKIRTALGLINQALDEVLSEQESDCDAETRWALAWFEQHQFDEGPFDDANTLANAKALSVDGLRNIGLVQSRAGKVRLLRRDELPADWVPSTDRHLTVWRVTQQLIRLLATSGQDAARILVGELGGMAETARELAYRLYTLCQREGWAEEAGYYNALVIAWPAIRSQEFTLTGDK